MSLSTTTNKVILQGNGTAGTAGSSFSYSFIVPAIGDAVVTYTDTAGSQTILNTSQYTITGLNDANGGTLTYPLTGSAIPTGATLTLERVMPYTQETVLSNQGAYYPTVVESALDYLTMLNQQLYEQINRAIVANPADVSPTMQLPVAAVRASMYLGFDPSGNLAVLSPAGTPVWSNVLSKSGGTMTGPINETMATVSSLPTTADIWGATASDIISWTGTATTTGFPMAPVAGARRLLVCAAACKFTAGANLLIRGIASGITVTMKANAFVSVLALSTTQFQLEYSLNGQFTASGTGFTIAPTATWYYSVVNGRVQIQAHSGNTLSGTSNATSLTITGFPAEITPADNRLFTNLVVTNNSALVYTGYAVLASTSIMTLYTDPSGPNWSSSASKGMTTNSFSYGL